MCGFLAEPSIPLPHSLSAVPWRQDRHLFLTSPLIPKDLRGGGDAWTGLKSGASLISFSSSCKKTIHELGGRAPLRDFSVGSWAAVAAATLLYTFPVCLLQEVGFVPWGGRGERFPWQDMLFSALLVFPELPLGESEWGTGGLSACKG